MTSPPSYIPPRCVHQLFEAQVERTPDAIALVFEMTKLTYRELNSRANQLAHRLRSMGVGPEIPVGVCLESSLEMVVGLLGILKAGGVYLPLIRLSEGANRLHVGGFSGFSAPDAGRMIQGIAGTSRDSSLFGFRSGPEYAKRVGKSGQLMPSPKTSPI